VYLYPLFIPTVRAVTGPISTLPKYTKWELVFCYSVHVNIITTIHVLLRQGVLLRSVFQFMFTTRSRSRYSSRYVCCFYLYLQHTVDILRSFMVWL